MSDEFAFAEWLPPEGGAPFATDRSKPAAWVTAPSQPDTTDDPYATALAAARLLAKLPEAPRLVFTHGRSLGQDYVSVWAGQVAPGRLVAMMTPELHEQLRAQMAEEGLDD